MLDEPFAAIDPITVHSIQEIIRQLSQEGISILVTDHKERETLQITQRSYVIRSGQVLCHGTPEEVLNNEEARKVYFGNDVAVGNSTVHLPPAQHALPPQAAPPNAPGLQPGVKSGLQSGLQPRPGFIRPRPKPVETLRTDRPEAVPAPPRKVEPMPARP
ncbi:MAG TPA: hypothetical protein DEB39_05730, partial [Planctomycetaceae bacterium]|nr:hypothetical protein [Planctomycetaceae bacterium]